MENAPPRRLAWVELLKAIALVAIFLDHVAERLFGSPYFGNPDADWPPFWERVGQLLTAPASSGKWGFVLAALRDTAWLGDQGVSLFLVVSGLTLAWSCASNCEPGGISWSKFYQRRLLRIYPIWIAANLLLLYPFAIFGVHVSLLDPRLYLSLAGIRVLPDQLYYGNSAWWFVTLLLQLYLVFPLLWMVLKRFGLVVFGIGVPVVALAIRGAGLLVFHDYLDAWSRGVWNYFWRASIPTKHRDGALENVGDWYRQFWCGAGEFVFSAWDDGWAGAAGVRSVSDFVQLVLAYSRNKPVQFGRLDRTALAIAVSGSSALG